MAPKYPLEQVQAAARDRNIEIDQARGWKLLSPLFDGLEDCLNFARDVIMELTAEDFVKTVSLPNPPHAGDYDEYGKVVSQAVLARHDVVDTDWYLKLKLDVGQLSEGVFLVSFHPAERPLKPRSSKPTKGGRP